MQIKWYLATSGRVKQVYKYIVPPRYKYQDFTPRYLPGENLLTHAEQAMFKDVHHSNVYNRKISKQPKCPPMRQWINYEIYL